MIGLTISDTLPPQCDIAVIGSGAGGAVTAATLAAAGRDTLILEEGGLYAGDAVPYSRQEMLAAYRRRGMTVALGKTPVNYIEACCVGGGSEINSGFYHRPPADLMQRWVQAGVTGADSREISELCAANEALLAIKPMPAVQPQSQRLAAGAAALELSCHEVPRWHHYDEQFTPEAPGGVRRSMARTFLPEFIAHGGRLVAECKVQRLQPTAAGWQITAQHRGTPVTITARRVFVAAGAIATPLLLRRSGFSRRIGNSLHMHIYTRVMAEFAEPVNGRAAGIGPHQVDGMVPRLRFGCGVSTPEHLAAALAQCGGDRGAWLQTHDEKWRYRSAYYASVSSGMGWVRAIGGSEAVFYRLPNDAYYDLADATRTLCRMLLRAGAVKVLPIIKGAQTLTAENQLWRLPRPLPPAQACLSSVHLMGSCPMGRAGAADAFGAVYGAKGLYVADASFFCGSININPQGSVMAFARRNANHFLQINS